MLAILAASHGKRVLMYCATAQHERELRERLDQTEAGRLVQTKVLDCGVIGKSTMKICDDRLD